MKEKNTSINLSASGKLVLCGEHAVLNRQPAIAFAIKQRMFVKISQTDGNDVFIKSKFGNIVLNNLNEKNNLEFKKNKQLPDWCQTIYFLLSQIQHKGLNIEIKSKIKNYGFGSSGALFSCVCCGLLLLKNKNLSKQDLLKKTLKLYFKYYKNNSFKPSGIDIATSILGGIIYYFPVKKIAINLSPDLLKNFKIFAIYTGHKTQTMKTINITNKICKKNDIYKKIGLITSKIAFLAWNPSFDGQKFFNFLKKNQLLLKQLNLVDEDTKNIIEQCKKQNICAKISGSGLGDCVIAICKKNKNFTINDYEKIEINIDENGIQYDFEQN